MALRILGVGVLLAGCAASAPQGVSVSPDDYLAAIRGNTLVGSGGGNNWRIHVAEDLTRRGVVFMPRGQMAMTGRFYAGSDGVCSVAPEVRNGEARCSRMYRQGDVFEAVHGGVVESMTRIVPGNPYGL
ncbi:hypothetical protein GXW78_13230 [Roseomonas terrae]|uniref:Lipoprotein n=1 Tax=Neoroseomonas terrae TaxID=424799 RepID=A0ABS5EHX9_9PROT|nr:hypothetical protein [Neoroseomonas terrae]MBR0650632.1 hypothetical protein [Neoroseomonas terrae]